MENRSVLLIKGFASTTWLIARFLPYRKKIKSSNPGVSGLGE